MGSTGIEIPESDPVRTYTPDADRRLATNLEGIAARVHSNEFGDRPIDLSLLRELHRALFDEVRDHAGTHRHRGWGPEYLEFGPNRSSKNTDVESELIRALAQARTSVDSLRANADSSEYESSSLHVAIWIHAEVIKIHPFVDGNGRTSRLILNLVLVSLGFRPVALEMCKQEYIGLLNDYFRRRDFQVLYDGMLRLMWDQLQVPA